MGTLKTTVVGGVATDYLDGVVKGDTLQIETYVNACLAVKAKYPKV